eukprot:scaffold209570_cov17-Tisochrysis_lutea.AAC.1
MKSYWNNWLGVCARVLQQGKGGQCCDDWEFSNLPHFVKFPFRCVAETPLQKRWGRLAGSGWARMPGGVGGPLSPHIWVCAKLLLFRVAHMSLNPAVLLAAAAAAAVKQDSVMVEMLLQVDNFGDSVLHLAAAAKQENVMVELLRRPECRSMINHSGFAFEIAFLDSFGWLLCVHWLGGHASGKAGLVPCPPGLSISPTCSRDRLPSNTCSPEAADLRVLLDVGNSKLHFLRSIVTL